jgi:hypothetical protein
MQFRSGGIVVNKKDLHQSIATVEVGDLIYRSRGGKKELSAVLATNQRSGRVLLTLSPFSSFIIASPHPKAIFLDNEEWLVDESGAIFLLPEEFAGIEKGGARDLLQSIPKAKNTDEKMEAIAQSLFDPRQDLKESAEKVLEIIINRDPSKEQVQLLCFAFEMFVQGRL